MGVPKKEIFSISELEKVRLFQSVDMQAIGEMLQLCPVRELSAGEQLISRGQSNDKVYLLLSGRLQVYLNEDKVEAPLISLQAGDSVGEMSVIDEQLTSATVVAQAACRLLVIERDVIWALLENLPVVARNLMHVMTERLRYGNSVIRRSQRLQRQLERHAITDTLTGFYNRRWLNETLPLQMDLCAGSFRPFSLCIADIDHFKDFNDRYGHLAGDEAIKLVAEAIRNGLRKSDLAVRFGGEEYLVLLPGADRDEATMVAEQIRQAVAEASICRSDGRPLPSLTVSVGFAVMEPEHSPEQLIEVADRCLYRAKQKGRNSVVG